MTNVLIVDDERNIRKAFAADVASAPDRYTLVDAIPGAVPHPLNLPKGCKFAPRCKYCQQRCLEEEPTLEKVSENQQVRCFYAGKEARRANLK